MFGYPCAFLRGNMATGLHEENWIVRLSEDDRAEIESLGGLPFEPMKGRKMREYRTIPPDVLADDDALAGWLVRSLGFVAGLPEKKPKKKR